MPTSEAVGQTYLGYTGERAQGGRILLRFSKILFVQPCRFRDVWWKVSYVFRGGVVQQFAKLCVSECSYFCFSYFEDGVRN